ncbi:MAG: hypothetical protein ACM3KR_03660 [Deltaproteobacteria bacterium]
MSKAKLLSFLFVFLTLFMLSACNENNNNDQPSQKNSSIQPQNIQDITNDIEKDQVNLDNLESNNGKTDTSKSHPVNKFDLASDYLLKEVPEIDKFRKDIENNNKSNDFKSRFIIRLDSSPNPNSTDKYAKDYFEIYVGEDLGDHTSRWNSFLVRQDLKEILVDDVISGEWISLEEWRAKQNQ